MAPPSRSFRRRVAPMALAVATVLASGSAAIGPAAAASPPPAPATPPPAAAAAPGPAARPFSVTLLTGDRVHVTLGDKGRYALRFDPGAGRSTAYVTRRTTTGLEVMPSDAAALVAADRVDRRFFDVVLLHRLGYHDAATQQLPVLLTSGRDIAARSRSARVPAVRPGTRDGYALTRLAARSARVAKTTAGTFWTRTKAAPATEKVWLLGRRQVSLDRSTAQVGAPAAWRAGYTGKGVTVAVLDSGYDPAHPDLKGVVTRAKNFTQARTGVKDVNGHGTHVASTVAGRGSAAQGRLAGVAKGASLAVGKVCDDSGSCPDDAVLAGMEWAVTTAKARVVNMSLGSSTFGGPDPLADALEWYTARTGALFVVAAGNNGPARETVGSPATAPSALAVGSIGRTGVLSEFSARGPVVNADRSGDYTLKPEITAPGEEIVAARAAGALADEATGPGKRYAALSGTSMATPHVAGGAAILAQRKPKWKAAQLKAALTATARPLTTGTVYEQGAGRMDLARAVTTAVTVDRGILDLGYARWPNADAAPVARKITYTNAGTRAVTLTLTPELRGPDGAPTRTGALSVDRGTVAVPAGKSSAVTLTFHPGQAPAGLLSGRLTARTADGGTEVATTLGAYREPESYNLSVTAYDRSGRLARAALSVAARGTGENSFVDVNRRAGTIRLPAGEHTVTALISEDGNGTTVIARNLVLDGTKELVLDARGGKRVVFTMPRPDAVELGMAVGLTATGHGGYVGGISIYTRDPLPVYLVAGPPVPGLSAELTADFARRGADGRGAPGSPWTYHIARALGDRLPADPTFAYRAGDFAAISSTYRRLTPTDATYTTVWKDVPGANGSFTLSTPLKKATTRTAYVAGTPGVTFAPSTLTFTTGRFDGGLVTLDSPHGSYVAGRRYTDRWQEAVFSPVFGDKPPRREGNRIKVGVPLYGDAAGHLGSFTDTGTMRLLRDGKQVAKLAVSNSIEATVPAAPATYRLESSTVHRVEGVKLSTRQNVAWTFRSAHVTGTTPATLPLSMVRFTPRLDSGNRTAKATTFTIPVAVTRAAGAPQAALRTLSVHVSYNGGRTWTMATVRRTGSTGTVTVRHPATAGTVSLRATATHADGSKVDQTVINAYLTK